MSIQDPTSEFRRREGRAEARTVTRPTLPMIIGTKTAASVLRLNMGASLVNGPRWYIITFRVYNCSSAGVDVTLSSDSHL
jgi:hypothetical protein